MDEKDKYFSMLFSILHEHADGKISKMFLFSHILFYFNVNYASYSQQWLNHNIQFNKESTRSLAYYIREDFQKNFSRDQYEKHIKTMYLPLVSKPKDLFIKLRDLLNEYSPPERIIDLFNQYGEEHLSSFITGMQYLCVTKARDLPYFDDLKNDLTIPKFVTDDDKNKFRKIMWTASQQNFFVSHRKNNRFANLNIIKSLLPNGYVEPDLESFHFECANDNIKNIEDVCFQSEDNMAIIGEGGIGKTTFLQVVMEKSFGTEEKPHLYDSNEIIPFFIELNRCPANIGESLDDHYIKSNFVTRQIADMIQATDFRYLSYDKLLEEIEASFRYMSDIRKSYLLLLDGFNEITTETNNDGISVRSIISHEITELSKLPNVRIISTSRLTKSADYAKSFTKVYLTGLKEEEIKKHLRRHEYSSEKIGQILANRNLMKCLAVPLFLCMFSAENAGLGEENLPDTYGEILHLFFHKTGKYYSIKKRSEEARTNPYRNTPFATELILEFILPHVGWHMVHADKFSLSKIELKECIETGINELKEYVDKLSNVDLPSFDYDRDNLYAAINGIGFPSNLDVEGIITCVRDYLCILYSYNFRSIKSGNPMRLGFVHHHIRDYFSAVYVINMLRLLPSLRDVSRKSLPPVLRDTYWNHYESETIGQILGEHHNSPILNPQSANWELPSPKSEGMLLTSLLDFLRTSLGSLAFCKTLLQNIINTLNICRGELSGICFDRLNLEECNIYNMTCSKKGKSKTLAASFRKAKISDYTLTPIEHEHPIEFCQYANDICVTIDSSLRINLWDILSGRLRTTVSIQKKDPIGHSFITKNHFCVSSNGKCIAVNMYLNKKSSFKGYLWTYGAGFRDVTYGTDIREIKLPVPEDKITEMQFSPDSKRLCLLTSMQHYYSLQLGESVSFYNLRHFDVPHTHYKLFPTISFDYDYVLAYDVDTSEENPNKSDVPCFLYRLNSSGNSEVVFTFHTAPEKEPVICYVAESDCFVAFNLDEQALCLFDCEFGTCTPILRELLNDHGGQIPSAIHPSFDGKNHVSIMYPNICYDVEINKSGIPCQVQPCELPIHMERLNGTPYASLKFVTDVAPLPNRFLLVDDQSQTYEWHIEESEPTPKYNHHNTFAVALIPDIARQIIMLVHKRNGISVFSQTTLALINASCSNFRDYQVTAAEYSNQLGMLILLHERGNHGIIESISMETSESKIISSEFYDNADFNNDNSITKLSISRDGLYLLTTSSRKCTWHSLRDYSAKDIYVVQANELLTGAFFDEDDIHIGIVTKDSKTPPRCEVYTIKENENYICKSGYFMPDLTDMQPSLFTTKLNDNGTRIPLESRIKTEYTVSQGFIFQENPSLKNGIQVKTFVKTGDRIRPTAKYANIENNKLFFALRKIPTSTYDYIPYDNMESIVIYKNKGATCLMDCQTMTKTHIEGKLSKSDSDSPIKYLPCCNLLCQLNNDLAAFSSENEINTINLHTGELMRVSEYLPGLAICGCDFRKAEFKTKNFQQLSRDIVENNGGKLGDP